MSFLIKQAFIVDGSGQPGNKGDVMVAGEHITAVAPHLSAEAGTEQVDGRELALCPGFVDAHSHSDLSILAAPEAVGKISQGITSEIIGNCGLSAFPVTGNNQEHLQELYRNYEVKISWRGLREYAAEVNRRQPAVNILALCGHNTLRAAVAGYEQVELSRQQETAMCKFLKDMLQDGAAGFSSGLLYVPGKFSDVRELCRLLKILAGFDRPYATHLRSEGNQLLEAVAEAITACSGAKQRHLHISHLKTAGEKNWHKLEDALAAITQATASNVNVTADCYPYIESMTQLSAILPEPYDSMDDVTFQRFIAVEHNFAAVRASLSKLPARRWETVRLINAKGMTELAGKTLAQIAQLSHSAPEQICAEILKADAVGAMAAFQGMSPENVQHVAELPFVCCGTDESARPEDFSIGRSHPRGFGSFPVWFNLLKKKLPLEEVIRKCTSLPAVIFGLKQRGRIIPGAYADLVLFDPAQFYSEANFVMPHCLAHGVRQVWVNGHISYPVSSSVANRSGRFILQ